MQPIVEVAQPYVTIIVTVIVGALAAVLLAAAGAVKSKAVAYFESKLDATQRELLHKVASEAYAYAETVFKSYEGQAKLAKALDYTTEQLSRKGIIVTSQEIRAAIEAAYLKAQTLTVQ